MTAYAPIADTSIDQNSPFVEEMVEALRDNPIAMFEGASGSPRLAIKWASGSATPGVPYVYAGLAAFSGIEVNATFNNSSGISRDLTIEFSDNGSTYYGATIVATVAAGEAGSIVVMVDFATAALVAINHGGASSALVSATVSGLSTSATYIRVTAATDLFARVILKPNGGQSAS